MAQHAPAPYGAGDTPGGRGRVDAHEWPAITQVKAKRTFMSLTRTRNRGSEKDRAPVQIRPWPALEAKDALACL